MEIFIDIPEFPMYKISNYGRIISHYRGSNKIIIGQPDEKGYLKTLLYRDKRPYPVRIHRLVAKGFIPNPSSLPQVNHKDGDKTNNHADNLEWISNIDNIRHSFYILGREGSSKVVTKGRVMEVVGKYKNGVSVYKIAEEYGITPRNVYKILHGKTYKMVQREIFRGGKVIGYLKT